MYHSYKKTFYFSKTEESANTERCLTLLYVSPKVAQGKIMFLKMVPRKSHMNHKRKPSSSFPVIFKVPLVAKPGDNGLPYLKQ